MAFSKQLINSIFRGERLRSKEKKWAARMSARKQVFTSKDWTQDSDTARRNYASYEDYVSHQSSKLDRIIGRLRGREDEDRAKFIERFKNCSALSDARIVLCLGARLGTEVAALHDLGYFAIGIDLNPGPDNPYVLPGDFHQLVFPDASVDAIYSNALDHAFDLEKLVAQVRRVLRPDGIFVIDLVSGYEEGLYPGQYESIHWHKAQDFAEKVSDLGGFALESTQSLGKLGRDTWTQAVLRKVAQAETGDAGRSTLPAAAQDG